MMLAVAANPTVLGVARVVQGVAVGKRRPGSCSAGELLGQDRPEVSYAAGQVRHDARSKA
jgi:hypothetical protein